VNIGQAVATLGVSFLALVAAGPRRPAQMSSPAAVIDMHVHAVPADFWGQAGLPNPATGHPSAATTDDAIMSATLAALAQHHVVKAMTSGPLELVLKWKAAAPDTIIGGPMFPFPGPMFSAPDLDRLRQEYVSGRLGVLGEVSAQYEGLNPSDPWLEPYLRLAEELDIPVGIHSGSGPTNVTYTCCPKHRIAAGNPLLLEDAIVRHPRLRIYLMHAGGPFLQEAVALMRVYPQVYADISAMDWIWPRDRFYEHLKTLMRAGMGKRLMFGSDQMIWPEAIGMAIDNVNAADFLTDDQKRDILYGNAARFLRLPEESRR
jgi:predicted TIM-barrel fold metal-dependent hydrolase